MTTEPRFLRLVPFLVAACAAHGPALSGVEADAPAPGVKQLRETAGRWATVTEFLGADGSVARRVEGTYAFDWVVPDRVLSGRAEIPELGQVTGILFYVNTKAATIEMVSVAADGKLWIMTGPADEETRYTQEFPTAAGGTGRLRFTRYNVTTDAFESKMEYTEDGGKTWIAGNRQTFRRIPPPG